MLDVPISAEASRLQLRHEFMQLYYSICAYRSVQFL